MTTDLTGDFEVGEDEFDWDVFLPDADEVDLTEAATVLEDETDESDFDWDGALRDDTGPESGGDDGGRAGAAYDRIVDTVRRSFEDEPSTQAETEPEADAGAVLGADDEPEARRDTEQVPVVSGSAASFAEPVESEADADPAVAWVPAAAFEPDEKPAPVVDLEPESTWGAAPESERATAFIHEPMLVVESNGAPDADLEADGDGEPELDHWLALDNDPPLAGTDLEPVAFEPVHEVEPAMPHFAEAATVGVVGALVPAQPPLSDEATWVTWEAGPPPEFVPDPAPAGSTETSHEKPKRSRVFKATVALACLFLVAVAAAVTVRALHHPTTTAAPPAHVTTPTQATSAADPAGSAASATGRMQAATDAVDSATTAASVGLTSLAAFPTPTNVETVINPYISSLQLYQTFLSGTRVPAAAQPAATAAAAKVRQDLQFLETIDGLPPQQLGAFLVQFDTDATQLQTTLSALEQELRTPAS